MAKIKSIIAREIKDSRGNPTVEVELETDKGSFIASCPSGASTGEHEALELRDEDGKGVQTAVSNVNNIIAPKLKGKDPEDQKQADNLMLELDGTRNKSKLGANAILPVSMAVCRAGAFSKKLPLYRYIAELASYKIQDTRHKLPLGMFNLLEGGRHVHPARNGVSGGAKNGLDIQEFIIVPQKDEFSENLAICNKVFNNLKELIEKNYGKIGLGDEGGFAPPISETEQALFLLKNAIAKEPVKIALDCAASQFYKHGKYILKAGEMTRSELLDFYKDLVKRFEIISIEDPFFEEDWNGFEDIVRFADAQRKLNKELIVVGDDLTTTNIKRIKEAHTKNACNGVILKLNQIGTVSETIEAAKLAKSFSAKGGSASGGGWKTIVSHRSGETMDDFIADLAVGTGADFLKAGSPAKPERMVKYKRLLEIENG